MDVTFTGLTWRAVGSRHRLSHVTSRARKIIDEALSLPKEELVGVVAELQQRVVATDSQGDIDAAWNDEIVRRVRAVQSGSAVLLDGEQVDRELSEVLDER